MPIWPGLHPGGSIVSDMNALSDKAVGMGLSVISCTGLAMGLLAVLSIIPSKYVWGGRVTDHGQLIALELVTLVTNCLIIWVIGMRTGLFRSRVSVRVLRAVLTVLTVIMLLNTFGNLAAKTVVEKIMAIPTLVSALGFMLLLRRGRRTGS